MNTFKDKSYLDEYQKYLSTLILIIGGGDTDVFLKTLNKNNYSESEVQSLKTSINTVLTDDKYQRTDIFFRLMNLLRENGIFANYIFFWRYRRFAKIT